MQRYSKTKDILTSKSPKIVSQEKGTVRQKSDFLPICPVTHAVTNVRPLLLQQNFGTSEPESLLCYYWFGCLFFKFELQFSLRPELLLEVCMLEVSKNQNRVAF